MSLLANVHVNVIDNSPINQLKKSIVQRNIFVNDAKLNGIIISELHYMYSTCICQPSVIVCAFDMQK